MEIKEIRLSVEKSYPHEIYGVDFSGAVDAGKKIWIAHGIIEKKIFHIKECFQALDLNGSGFERDQCLNALYDFIANAESAIFGMDFPFGLPSNLVRQKTWKDFATQFNSNYLSPEDFRNKCRSATNGLELKRTADKESKTPFSPYNLRMYRQTYFGFSKLICPLIQKDEARAIPMQKISFGKPWIIEVCPASLLKREKLYFPYKGKTKRHYSARSQIIETIGNKADIDMESVNSAALKDPNGDALDSILASIAAYRAVINPELFSMKNKVYAIEGYVYF